MYVSYFKLPFMPYNIDLCINNLYDIMHIVCHCWGLALLLLMLPTYKMLFYHIISYF